MSIPLACAALEKKLALMSAMSTAHENTSFTPSAGVAYQRVNHLINSPIDHAISADLVELRGLFQVTLAYPAGTGRGAAQARAQAIVDHFAPVQELTEGAVKVSITKTARISGGMVDGDRWNVAVTVPWSAFTN